MISNNKNTSPVQLTAWPVTAVAVLLLTACAQEDASINLQNNDQQSSLSMSPPTQLQTRAVVQQALAPEVRINGAEVIMVGGDATDNAWTGSATVPPGTDTTLEVLWTEDFGPNKLPLASIERDLGVINNNTSASVSEDDYIYDIHDDDDDGFSNLNERINNTNPYDPFDPGSQVAQVFIPLIDPADAPTIDGVWDTDIWPSAQYRDSSRARLDIHNLMVDQGATQLDQQPSYRWGAMHDGENLYVVIFAEKVSDPQTPFSDSADAFHDDSFDVFIDGNNSKSDTYDGVDDYQLIIPMFEAGSLTPNNSTSANVRIESGFNALPFPTGVSFAACFCNMSIIGEYTLEMSIPLSEVGITVGQPFGFEIQYNDDNDGGERDAKWGWFHPSKTATGPDVDFTWQMPKFMGTAELTNTSN